MDKNKKHEELGWNIIFLHFLGIEIENFKENINILEKSSIYFSVPKQYSTDFIKLVSESDQDDGESLKTEEGIIKAGKESIKKIINSYMELYDDEVVEDITEFFKLYAKIRDEEWELEKGKEKAKQMIQDDQKIMKFKNEWKEV